MKSIQIIQTIIIENVSSSGKIGAAHPSIVPYQAFRAKDMDMILAVANDGLWEIFLKVVRFNVIVNKVTK